MHQLRNSFFNSRSVLNKKDQLSSVVWQTTYSIRGMKSDGGAHGIMEKQTPSTRSEILSITSLITLFSAGKLKQFNETSVQKN